MTRRSIYMNYFVQILATFTMGDTDSKTDKLVRADDRWNKYNSKITTGAYQDLVKFQSEVSYSSFWISEKARNVKRGQWENI